MHFSCGTLLRGVFLLPLPILTKPQTIFSLQISITVPGYFNGRFAQERQEKEEGSTNTILLEKEEGKEEG